MSINVLLVDDSATIRLMIKKVLSISLGDALGNVYEAGDGISALSQLADNDITLMMIDLNMPRMNGMQLISRLKSNSKYSDIPIIVISTEGSEERIKELEELGIAGYVRKPFRPEQVRKVILNVVESYYGCQASNCQSGGDDGCDF